MDVIEYKKNHYYYRLLKVEVRRIIGKACGCYKQNFKMNIPISELIDYKVSDGNNKFEKFVSATDNIINGVKKLFPFIDLEGIDMNWTANQIIDKVFEMYCSVSTIKLK